MQRRLVRSTIRDGDKDENVFGRILGILDEHIEVAVLIEDAAIDQLKCHFVAAALLVPADQGIIGVCCVLVFVEVLHVRMRRGAVQVEVVFLDVFAVVTLAVGQPKEPFFQDRVPAVPKRQGKAKLLVIVGNSRQPVFTPAVGARPRLIMREIVPSIAIFAVVFTNRAPLPLTEVRAPFLPLSFAVG